MEKAFVDTGPLYEYGVAQERALYEKVHGLLTSQSYRWYSSTYVFDELMTLLLQRAPKPRVVAYGEKLRASSSIVWLHPSAEDEEGGWEVFRSFKDKAWSFTDCVSYHLIKTHQLKWALAFDTDFAQMGLSLL